jgi:hypothetical protein
MAPTFEMIFPWNRGNLEDQPPANDVRKHVAAGNGGGA